VLPLHQRRHGLLAERDLIVGQGVVNRISDVRRKNPAAVALGRLGGKKGGIARAKVLSKARRVEIARAAANARWNRR